jgi:hypothetical protein
MSWLERARNEIPKSTGLHTANTAKRWVSTVTAAPQPGESEIFGTSITDLRTVAGDDWHEVVADPALLEYLAHAVQTRRMRERGIVPAHYTDTTTCAHCGLVPIFPGVPARVLSCPWCFNRVAGKPVAISTLLDKFESQSNIQRFPDE